jgi:hypothetical protein
MSISIVFFITAPDYLSDFFSRQGWMKTGANPDEGLNKMMALYLNPWVPGKTPFRGVDFSESWMSKRVNLQTAYSTKAQ